MKTAKELQKLEVYPASWEDRGSLWPDWNPEPKSGPRAPPRRKVLVALQVVVVTVAVAATVVALLNPECVEHMLAEAARGVSAGLLFAGVKVLSKVSRPVFCRRSVRCWWFYGVAVGRVEFQCGLVGGFLLGLILAIWSCWAGGR